MDCIFTIGMNGGGFGSKRWASTLSMIFSAADSIGLAQHQLQAARVVSPTLM